VNIKSNIKTYPKFSQELIKIHRYLVQLKISSVHSFGLKQFPSEIVKHKYIARGGRRMSLNPPGCLWLCELLVPITPNHHFLFRTNIWAQGRAWQKLGC